MDSKGKQEPGFLVSKFPVLLPSHPALTLPQEQFDKFLKNDLEQKAVAQVSQDADSGDDFGDNTTLISTPPSTTADLREKFNQIKVQQKNEASTGEVPKPDEGHPFMKALTSKQNQDPITMENKMLTENADIAHRSTGEALVDLFSELEDVVSGPRLRELLNAAWQDDPLATLKIIFNARSIHLGKSSRPTTYRSLGWLAHEHPLTFLTNLQWLSRPVIEKKMEKKEDTEDDMVIVEEEKDENDPARFDVKNGVAHGYWKDLLNLLVLAVNDKLQVIADPRDVLNVHDKTKAKDRQWDAEVAKQDRANMRDNRHEHAVTAFKENRVYRALHLTVARLFAEQLKQDLVLLHSNDPKLRRQISLCAKWAPTHKCFHDKHTFIVSSIAEILHPQGKYPEIEDREKYLRHAREAYRKDVSALRKALEVVERDISAENFKNIKYDRIPSLAMNRYAGLFAKKDMERFDKYIENVALGKKQISGAVMLPSKLISVVRQSRWTNYGTVKRARPGSAKSMIEAKMGNMDVKVADGQWRTLVKRIKESGTLENSIAVCDVSGSMSSPTFSDGTTPMDSSIALSLLVAEVTKPPFGGAFITFSNRPTVVQVDLAQGLQEKVRFMEQADWGGSTDFEAVFKNLILPMARKHKLKQEDMVKQVFVFSDMQFNQAKSASDRWSTTFQRIQKEFKKYGYEVPRLIFWNLAGGRAGVTGRGDPTAPKPVTANEPGTALVSGYSQGMLKAFLDNGSFDEPEEEEEVVEEVQEDGTVKVEKRKKDSMTPLSTMRKAISHKAYSMLAVVD